MGKALVNQTLPSIGKVKPRAPCFSDAISYQAWGQTFPFPTGKAKAMVKAKGFRGKFLATAKTTFPFGKNLPFRKS